MIDMDNLPGDPAETPVHEDWAATNRLRFKAGRLQQLHKGLADEKMTVFRWIDVPEAAVDKG